MRAAAVRVSLLAGLLVPSIARADLFPYVTKGPVIVGVSQHDAWVAWETAHHEGSGTECSVEEHTPLAGNHNTDTPTVTLDGSTKVTDSHCALDHRVHLTGLSPDTHYRFTLDKPYKDNSTAGGDFTTAPSDPEQRFEFVVYGDSRDNQTLGTSTRSDHQAVANAVVGNEGDAAFLLHTGDLALNLPLASGDDRGYTEFFDIERALLSTRPLFAAIGNHETIDTKEFDALVNPHVFAGTAHPYYSSFDWGPVHVALVDDFEGPPAYDGLGGKGPGVSDAQVAWLDKDLAAAYAAGKPTFVVAHQSPFCHPDPTDTAGHSGSIPMQDKVLPLLLKYRVMAVFGGHDHFYQRGHEDCLDYYVVGGGGAPLHEPDKVAPGVAFALKSTSYVVVTVDGSRITGVAKDTHNSILDTFTFSPADGTSCGVRPAPLPGQPDGGNAVEPGKPDAGAPEIADAGVEEIADAGVSEGAAPDAGVEEKASQEGCNCAAAGFDGAALLAAAALVRRRKNAHRAS